MIDEISALRRRADGAEPPLIAFGSRVRPSPFFEATMRWGASAWTVYNHMLMPSVYESATADYHYLINGVTLWDVAAERQVEISGRDAFRFTQYLTPRNLQKCRVGQCRYVLITNGDGGVINDPVLLRLEENRFWLSAADADLLLWCQGAALNTDFDVQIKTPDVSPLQLQGPRALQTAAALFGDWVGDLRYFHLRQFDFEKTPLVISRTGWSGELGFEIYLQDGERGDWLWERIMAAGRPFNIRPAAPSTIRRIEGGLLSYGADTHLHDTPFHLRLDRLVDADGDFIGRQALLKLKASGVGRRLTGLVIDGEPLPSPSLRWWNIYGDKKENIGKVRSAVFSPTLQKNIGIAMLKLPHAVAQPVLVRDENGDMRAAKTHALPFIQPKK